MRPIEFVRLKLNLPGIIDGRPVPVPFPLVLRCDPKLDVVPRVEVDSLDGLGLDVGLHLPSFEGSLTIGLGAFGASIAYI